MKKIEVEPRSAEWHAVRAESWTASQAATLVVRENAEMLRDYAAGKGIVLDIEPLLEVGLESFYGNTPWTVWAEKNGRIPRFAGNDHTERGTRNEDKVLSAFEADQLFLVEREVTAQYSAYPGLMASFDALASPSTDPANAALAPYGFPVEAKCPAFPSRKKLWDSRKAGKLGVMGLPYYWCQVQHQMLVAEAPYAWFVAAGVEEEAGVETVVFPLVEKVPRDDRFLVAYEAIARFFHEEFIDAYLEPPKLPSDLRLLAELQAKAEFERALSANNSDLVAELYLDALQEEASAAAKRKELEAKLISLAEATRQPGDTSIAVSPRIVVQYSESKAISWQKVVKQLLAAGQVNGADVDAASAACESKRPSTKVKVLDVVEVAEAEGV